MNVFIPKRTPKYAKIYDGDRYIIECAEKIIQRLQDDNRDRIDDYIDKYRHKLTPYNLKRHEQVRDDPEYKSKSKEDIRICLLNNEEQVKANFKNLKYTPIC